MRRKHFHHITPQPPPPPAFTAISDSLRLLMALNFISLKSARPYKYAMVCMCAWPVAVAIAMAVVAIDYIVNGHTAAAAAHSAVFR